MTNVFVFLGNGKKRKYICAKRFGFLSICRKLGSNADTWEIFEFIVFDFIDGLQFQLIVLFFLPGTFYSQMFSSVEDEI